jgi:undecaprenyl phosphate-alpha-L-ara4FN deformylase
MLVALKIDLFSLRAAGELLPLLLDMLREYEVQASFFPALGPDPDAGPGPLRRWMGGSPVIAERMAGQLAAILEQGHEVGAVPWDVGAWRRLVLERDAAWTRQQLDAGARAYRKLFGAAPRLFCAPDFLLNADVSGIEAELGFDFALDSRGLHPYRPLNPDGPGRCPQVPVTLPRIEDLLAAGEPLANVHQVLFMESQKPLEQGHVFNFTAADPAHLPVLEKLLVMWKGSQRDLNTVGHLVSDLDLDVLPAHQCGMMRRGGDGPFQAVQGQRVGHD